MLVMVLTDRLAAVERLVSVGVGIRVAVLVTHGGQLGAGTHSVSTVGEHFLPLLRLVLSC